MTTEEIKHRIESAVPGSQAHVLDPMNDGAHLQAFVISPAFEGMPVFKQQQMVMASIKDVFQVVHALGLKTFTPAKWDEAKSQYGL
ncbi:MAG: BolA/IbaG family iron-sulfur metabolism protein [Candidatus Omnitrophica bacterium]|nr:BolA/IbaG family iron-sulfur metabolism protein [Candidatus Omnitrophota bacterium]MDE2009008.1 BolA/IbaG family iron-sulfur metabolism protein [Candidatus Omnitrophota bacterium]MDE2214532.1 BolA/IbaG family iron-sulfur metabolism protein [Candidatus Omnitrophota bacterium]MDE2230850.1 BolA/IbaG family iron-sulfur metabolism protein [Candidatus Omnitrophota bacterium]